MENNNRVIRVCYGEYDINDKKLNKTTNFAKLFVYLKFLKDKSLRPFLDVLFKQDVNFLVPDNKIEIV